MDGLPSRRGRARMGEGGRRQGSGGMREDGTGTEEGRNRDGTGTDGSGRRPSRKRRERDGMRVKRVPEEGWKEAEREKRADPAIEGHMHQMRGIRGRNTSREDTERGDLMHVIFGDCVNGV